MCRQGSVSAGGWTSTHWSVLGRPGSSACGSGRSRAPSASGPGRSQGRLQWGPGPHNLKTATMGGLGAEQDPPQALACQGHRAGAGGSEGRAGGAPPLGTRQLLLTAPSKAVSNAGGAPACPRPGSTRPECRHSARPPVLPGRFEPWSLWGGRLAASPTVTPTSHLHPGLVNGLGLISRRLHLLIANHCPV